MAALRSERMPKHKGKYKEQLTPTLTANFNLQVADALQSEGQSRRCVCTECRQCYDFTPRRLFELTTLCSLNR
eukprot:scaffold37269_cov144-Skeletonema_dohrnii-CCMP3373.AAC.2